MADARSFDLVVLGTGTAGSTIAKACRQAGWSVAVADTRAFGGTCALRGCEPKKVLWTLAEALDRARRLGPAGLVQADALSIDWTALQRFKQSFTDPVPDSTAEQFQRLGIESFRGETRFTGRDRIAVGPHRLAARHIVIATGARPAPLSIEGAELLATSEDFLALDHLPDHLILVGGGYIAFEIAHIARRGGAEVTILHQDDRPLAGFDPTLVDRLLEETRRVGIRFEPAAEVARVERRGDSFAVIARQNGRERRFDGDLALHAAGRVADLDALALDQGGIERNGRRLKLDPHLRSVSNPIVFAAGDAAQVGPPLTPVASIDAGVVTRNLLEGCSHRPDYRGVPSVVFAIPPLARVGLTVEEAQQQGIAFDLHEGDMAGYQAIRRLRHEAAAYRVLVERRTRRILGAHLLGPGVEEVINLFGLAIRLDLDTDAFGKLVSAYPSFGSNVEAMLK
jgi:glutathione reductase (NADPH)